MEISIRKTRPVRVPVRRLHALGASLLDLEGWPADCEVDAWFCSDEEMRELNRAHRGKDRPTDVLSFPQFSPGERPVAGLPPALGDVVISVDTVVPQAARHGKTTAGEIAWLFLHAMLHLLGYDDDTDDAAQLMDDRARAAIAAARAGSGV